MKIATAGTTIPHEMVGKFGASSVHLIPAKEGTGVIAGGAARSIIDLAGIKDIVTKRHGSSNKINLVKATLNGLKALKTKEQILNSLKCFLFSFVLIVLGNLFSALGGSISSKKLLLTKLFFNKNS